MTDDKLSPEEFDRLQFEAGRKYAEFQALRERIVAGCEHVFFTAWDTEPRLQCTRCGTLREELKRD